MNYFKRIFINDCVAFTVLILVSLAFRMLIDGKKQMPVSGIFEMFLLTTAIILLQTVTNRLRMKSVWMYVGVQYLDCLALIFVLNAVFKWFPPLSVNILYVLAILTVVFAASYALNTYRMKCETDMINKRIEEVNRNK